MDEMDVEILWTLKQSESHYLKEIDIRKNNPKLTDNDELEAKLRYLEEGKFIEAVPAVFGYGHLLKKTGNDLFWNGKLKKRILNLLYVCDYTLSDLKRLLYDDSDNVSRTIQLLQEEPPLLVERHGGSSDGAIRHAITSLGETYTHPNFVQLPTNVESFSQIHIGQINVQNFETKIDELILEVDKEPNLSEEHKIIFKKKLINLKNAWGETYRFGQPILQQLTLDGLKELFPKSPVL
ncbi:MAG: hypothetical protein OEQ15_04305 [Nitrosopumilus sp.]|nr:hypothetical protein [Nitrosopumilus sp.]MDH3793883.1 hypothetical protein [Nitrosopumilus sp.]MDH3854934.1 hypothetical protein [Nitrosopumilus sp.]